MTLSSFANSTQFPELARAVVRQCGGWESFQETAEDVANHGANCGFHGFIYYRETVAFAKRHKAAIIAACREMASEIGEAGAYSLIASFQYLKLDVDTVAEAIHNPRSDEHTNVLNTLAWFALEEVARAYVYATEREKD